MRTKAGRQEMLERAFSRARSSLDGGVVTIAFTLIILKLATFL